MKTLRYEEVARALAEGIFTGRLAVGDNLPTEHELCKQFDASRHTVRSALRELQELGLVSRRRRAGTRVESAQAAGTGYRESLASVEDLVQLAATHERAVQAIEVVVMDRSLARRLGARAGSEWLRISSLRLDKAKPARPIGWTDVYVDSAYEALRKVVRKFPQVLISSMIETRYGRRIAEVQQTVEAVGVPVHLAGPLSVPAGSHALRIVRHYRDAAGKAFEISETIHPADRFNLNMKMRRERPV